MLFPEGGDPFELATHEYGMRDGAKRAEIQSIEGLIPHQNPAGDGFELVAVMPELVGSEALLVDERAAFIDAFGFSNKRGERSLRDR